MITLMSDKGMLRVKVGCCGFPGGMKKYFSQFRLVEVQQTFYKMPRLKTAQKWRQEAPSDFEFTLKAWQLITHSPTSATYLTFPGYPHLLGIGIIDIPHLFPLPSFSYFLLYRLG